MGTTFGHVGGALDQERQGPWGRFYKRVKARLDAILLTQWTWEAVRIHECWHVLRERPRKRQLQGLPGRVVALQQRLNAFPQAAERYDRHFSTNRLAPMGPRPRRGSLAASLRPGPLAPVAAGPGCRAADARRACGLALSDKLGASTLPGSDSPEGEAFGPRVVGDRRWCGFWYATLRYARGQPTHRKSLCLDAKGPKTKTAGQSQI
jgi:hypothetical protein